MRKLMTAMNIGTGVGRWLALENGRCLYGPSAGVRWLSKTSSPFGFQTITEATMGMSESRKSSTT